MENDVKVLYQSYGNGLLSLLFSYKGLNIELNIYFLKNKIEITSELKNLVKFHFLRFLDNYIKPNFEEFLLGGKIVDFDQPDYLAMMDLLKKEGGSEICFDVNLQGSFFDKIESDTYSVYCFDEDFYREILKLKTNLLKINKLCCLNLKTRIRREESCFSLFSNHKDNNNFIHIEYSKKGEKELIKLEVKNEIVNKADDEKVIQLHGIKYLGKNWDKIISLIQSSSLPVEPN